jgi:hypothetical protein
MSSQAVAWAIVHTAGGPSAKAVLLSIANYADASGECWQDQATLAAGAECSVRQFRNILYGLIERGLVEQVRRGSSAGGRRPNLIQLRMRELPVIISAKEPTVTECRKPAIQSNRQRLPETQLAAKIAGRVSGNLEGGNRQMVAGIIESHYPTNSNSKKHPVPSDWVPSQALITFAAERGFSEHEAKFMGQQMVTHFEATNERRPGWDATYKTWVNRTNPRQVKALAAQWAPLDYAAALRIWAKSEYGAWAEFRLSLPLSQ